MMLFSSLAVVIELLVLLVGYTHSLLSLDLENVPTTTHNQQNSISLTSFKYVEEF